MGQGPINPYANGGRWPWRKKDPRDNQAGRNRSATNTAPINPSMPAWKGSGPLDFEFTPYGQMTDRRPQKAQVKPQPVAAPGPYQSEDLAQQRGRGPSLAPNKRRGGYPPVSDTGGFTYDQIPGTMDYRERIIPSPWQPFTQGSISSPTPLNAALQGNGGYSSGVWTPGYQSEYDRERGMPAFKGVRADGETLPYADVLSGKAFGYAPGGMSDQFPSDIKSFPEPGTDLPADVVKVPSSTYGGYSPAGARAWQKELDYQDASDRERQRKAINSFSGIPRYLYQAGGDMADSLRTSLGDRSYDAIEDIRVNRGKPADAQATEVEMPAYAGPGGGGGDGGGYGGGYGGYPESAAYKNPWYMNLYSWRL